MTENAAPQNEHAAYGTALTYAVGEPIVFEGYIDDFDRGVAGMQFSLDNGTTWTTYPTAGADPRRGVRWRFEYVPTKPGSYVLKARSCASDGTPAGIVESFAFEATDLLVAGTSRARGSFGLRPVGRHILGEAKLYRSGELGGITPAEALMLVNGLGVRSIYDIRNKWEVASRPEPYLTGVRMLAVEPSTETRPRRTSRRLRAGVIREYGAPGERMDHNYRRYVNEYPLLGTVLRSIASQDAPALVHCKNGKDRTGVLCATALKIAGYDDDFIMEDYLLTNEVNAAAIERDMETLGEGMDEEELLILRSFFEARPAYLHAFFEEIDARYGSFDAYVRAGLLLTVAQRAHLEELLA